MSRPMCSCSCGGEAAVLVSSDRIVLPSGRILVEPYVDEPMCAMVAEYVRGRNAEFGVRFVSRPVESLLP
jgi:hypothetical protein